MDRVNRQKFQAVHKSYMDSNRRLSESKIHDIFVNQQVSSPEILVTGSKRKASAKQYNKFRNEAPVTHKMLDWIAKAQRKEK